MRSEDTTRPGAPAGHRWTWRTVLLAFAVAYGTYAAARWLGAGEGAAHANAGHVVDLERALGLDVEGPVQRAFDAPAAVWILNHLYMAAQFLVVPAALLLVRHASVPAFRRLRDVLLLTWVLATPVNAFFPVAPPRMAGIGVTDTITASGSSALTSGLSTALYNPLAAVPSLHVAFAFTVGIAIVMTFRSRVLRTIGALWGPVITLAVVATGNHYVVDAVAGVALAACSYGLLRLPAPRPALGRLAARPSLPAAATLVRAGTAVGAAWAAVPLVPHGGSGHRTTTGH
ncbi:phosphatase PAP2 family protein [Patulibacter sp. NPDC049589]|uniref:phosphatase PAP2 family protein n=1 Tax=Patulibacter sp. NPDC049589 TaxID=3154731 RepID=UPI003435B89B